MVIFERPAPEYGLCDRCGLPARAIVPVDLSLGTVIRFCVPHALEWHAFQIRRLAAVLAEAPELAS